MGGSRLVNRRSFVAEFVIAARQSVIVGVVTRIDRDRELHFGRHNQVVTVLHTHFSQALGLAGNGLFALDVDVHLLFLDELSQLCVLHVRQNNQLEDLESLIRADLDLEGLVQLVVQLRRLDSDVQVQRPRLFLPVTSRVLAAHLTAVHASRAFCL